MSINSYEELSSFHLDVLKEIGSVGAGNAATALATTVPGEMKITVPQVKILSYDKAMDSMGSPEDVMLGEFVQLSGEINGFILFLQGVEYVNLLLSNFGMEKLEKLEKIDEMGKSAATEIGNIIISAYVNAISSLLDIQINVSVPSVAVDMLGSISSLAMIKYAYESNSIMLIEVEIICDNEALPTNLILMPDVHSLDYLMKKLGIDCG